MRKYETAQGRWGYLDGQRQSFLFRCEKYSALTIPKLCPPQDYDQNLYELQHDYQAVGAQCVNNLANKVMLASFAPSRPFFRLDLTDAAQKEVEESGLDASGAQEALSMAEKKSVQALGPMRPVLIEALKHLIVIGNVLIELGKDTIRSYGIRKYVVRRGGTGKVVELILSEKMLFDELSQDVQDALRNKPHYAKADGDEEVCLYKWVKLEANGRYSMTQWVDEAQLPKKFNGNWSEEDMPFIAVTWELSSGSHYGTGLVEDYIGDFVSLSQLSEAQVVGAILAAEFRWLVNPAGQTRPEDFEASRNGAALPGSKDDIIPVESSKSRDLQVMLQLVSEYTKRIGRGFLMGSAVTRDAERVTAEEIRMMANELETAFGGVYSRLSNDLQLPLARYLMKRVGVTKGVNPTIVTGIEALSRQGDLDDFKLWLGDMAAANNLPDSLLARLKMDQIATALATPRRIKAADYVKTDAQFQQEQAQARQQQMAAEAATAGAKAGADVAVRGPQQNGR